MQKHILQKRRDYAQLFNRARKLGISKADFRYYVVRDANESMHLLELNGQPCDWADECLRSAQDFVNDCEQSAEEHSVELAYEQHLENQGEPEGMPGF